MDPNLILDSIYARAVRNKTSFSDLQVKEKIEFVALCTSNRACVRLLMSCMLGKIHNPRVDPRNPYTEIGSPDSFSGRTYDERYLTQFITKHRLPVNPTTAFLTPTLRNINAPLTVDRELVGRPRCLYAKTLELLDDVAKGRASAEEIFEEAVRVLLRMRDEKMGRISSLITALERGAGTLPMSSEAIVTLIAQHLACRNASRLPVLIVAAAYQCVGTKIGERVLPLNGHNSADLQTRSLGDVEICLIDDRDVVTAYEMKMKRVTQADVDHAVTKIRRAAKHVDNYIFVTTETIDPIIAKYAGDHYTKLDGVEIAVLDCVSFLKHFLHFFHRGRSAYLDAYQALVLNEPDSAVSQSLKEAFLALRQAAESGE